MFISKRKSLIGLIVLSLCAGSLPGLASADEHDHDRGDRKDDRGRQDNGDRERREREERDHQAQLERDRQAQAERDRQAQFERERREREQRERQSQIDRERREREERERQAAFEREQYRLLHAREFNHYAWMVGDEVANNGDLVTYCYSVANDGSVMNAGNPVDENLCSANVGLRPALVEYFWLGDGRCYARNHRGDFLNRRGWVDPGNCRYSPPYVRVRGVFLSQNDKPKTLPDGSVEDGSRDSKLLAFGTDEATSTPNYGSGQYSVQ